MMIVMIIQSEFSAATPDNVEMEVPDTLIQVNCNDPLLPLYRAHYTNQPGRRC